MAYSKKSQPSAPRLLHDVAYAHSFRTLAWNSASWHHFFFHHLVVHVCPITWRTLKNLVHSSGTRDTLKKILWQAPRNRPPAPSPACFNRPILNSALPGFTLQLRMIIPGFSAGFS